MCHAHPIPFRRCFVQITGFVLLSGLLLFSSIIIQVRQGQSDRVIHHTAEVTQHEVGVILGASVKRDGTPSDALRDRVIVGVEVYKEGKVHKLLMTGDDGKFHTNEVAAMKKIAMDLGVPEHDILTDGHGYRTYESCKRAVARFHITSAVIITQDFHLRRALYLCQNLGMTEIQGLSADRHVYKNILYFTLRDLLATVKAWSDISLIPPTSPVVYQE